jgi:hypothetical protein
MLKYILIIKRYFTQQQYQLEYRFCFDQTEDGLVLLPEKYSTKAHRHYDMLLCNTKKII